MRPLRTISSRCERACIHRITWPYGPGTRSPTPAIWASYAIRPTIRNPGRFAISAASSAACSGSLTDERSTPARSLPASAVNAASMSRHMRISWRDGTASTASSMASRCSGQSTISVISLAARASPASSASAFLSVVG